MLAPFGRVLAYFGRVLAFSDGGLVLFRGTLALCGDVAFSGRMLAFLVLSGALLQARGDE